MGSAHQVFNLHVLQSCASSIFTCFFFVRFLISSLHLSFGLPIFWCPPNSMFSLLHLIQSFYPRGLLTKYIQHNLNIPDYLPVYPLQMETRRQITDRIQAEFKLLKQRAEELHFGPLPVLTPDTNQRPSDQDHRPSKPKDILHEQDNDEIPDVPRRIKLLHR